MHVKPDVMSAMGKVHGGAMSTLTDTAIGYGCYLNKAKVRGL
jgi:acyl-coenzyme A thioesterase PaaI-like protein